MNTYLFPADNDKYAMFCFNDVTKNITGVIREFSHIQSCFVIPEDGTLIVSENDSRQVNKNDIVILFYKDKWTKHEVVIIKSNEWLENILSLHSYSSKKEKMREQESDDCCECCKEN